MRFLLINENGAKYIDIENTNEAIDNALGWDDAWNTPTIKVRGHSYIAICSDKGKLRHEPVSALSYSNLIAPKQALREPFMVGAIIITKFDGIDDFEGLNDEDIETLDSRLYSHGKPHLKDYLKTLLIIDG